MIGPSPLEGVHPSPSALQTLINSRPVPNKVDAHLYHLALQIAHNLRYQHNWTDIRIHHRSTNQASHGRLPRPMISGFPPQRLYVHPDEQLELLQQQKRAGKTGLPDLERQREWVLPSHLRERWSLRRFGKVFDGIAIVPGADGEVLFADEVGRNGDGNDKADEGERSDHWRLSQPKRLILATLEDDSTTVYYIVHDGLVKPRQN